MDGTLGNGHDSVFLANLVGDSGKVLGFDVQAAAVETARQRLLDHGLDDRVTLRKQSHEHMADELDVLSWPPVKVMMFNLGYLPGSDKSVITEMGSTLKALDGSINALADGGALSIVAYRGHSGGSSEYEVVQSWVDALDPEKFFCARYERWLNKRGQTPVLLWVKRR